MRQEWLAAMIVAFGVGLAAQPLTLSPEAVQQQPAAVRAQEAVAVIEALAAGLEQNFVFPDVGRAYAAMLRENLRAGAYDSFGSKEAFAEAVTADLQALQKEGHLRLFAPKLPGAKPKFRTAPSAEGAIGRSGWLTDGVAYIQFTMFPGEPETLEKIKSFLDAHSTATTLIIDVRAHHGGDIKEADLIASYLFSKEEELAHMDTRTAFEAAGDAAFEEGATMRRVSGPEGVVRRAHLACPGPATPLRDAKVLVLTSKKTVSAGEAFAMGLKITGRATLIGETTRGAGHFGDQYPLPQGYSAFIPVGRSFDPKTGQGWEGVGVTPHVEVPAEQALDEALGIAGVKLSGERALALLK